jgi:hypothetical protein
MIRLIAVILIFTACNMDFKKAAKREPANSLTMDCQDVLEGITRCENAEVVCYFRGSESMSCKFFGR